MAKKNIVARARLVKGSRWYIDFTRIDLETGAETRHRQDFDLNDIDDLRVREEVGQRLVRYIEAFAQEKKPAPAIRPDEMTVRQAVEYVAGIKATLPRKNSRKTYAAISKKLLAWCARLHYAGVPVSEFGKKHCRAFWDALLACGQYRGRSLNNYLVCLRTMWNELADRELVQENPWAKIKPERVGEKVRRPFTDQERRVVAEEIERTDYWMFRGVLLQFFCYIRPAELLRLRFKNFDLGAGTVTVESSEAKTWKKRVVTIPKSVLPYFTDGTFDRQPANYYLFGRKEIKRGLYSLEPATVQMSECRMYKRHRRVLDRLKEQGKLSDITGLHWYSWKDTGISMHTRKTSPVATKDQAGHADLSITSVYYHADPLNVEYRGLENDLMQ